MNKYNSNSKSRELAYNNVGSGGGASSIYSTDETVIGKWFDGKNVYRKVFVYNSAPETINSEERKYILDGINSILPVSLFGYFTLSSDTIKPLIPSADSISSSYRFGTEGIRENELLFRITNVEMDVITGATIILEYVKND